MVGTYIAEKRHYYYGNFGERYRRRTDAKTAHSNFIAGRAFDEALTNQERDRLRKEFGVSGVSILYRLYNLYAFDPVHDMVIDRMHLSFNLLKREFLECLWPEMGDNALRDPNDRIPADGGLMFRGDFREMRKTADVQRKTAGCSLDQRVESKWCSAHEVPH